MLSRNERKIVEGLLKKATYVPPLYFSENGGTMHGAHITFMDWHNLDIAVENATRLTVLLNKVGYNISQSEYNDKDGKKTLTSAIKFPENDHELAHRFEEEFGYAIKLMASDEAALKQPVLNDEIANIISKSLYCPDSKSSPQRLGGGVEIVHELTFRPEDAKEAKKLAALIKARKGEATGLSQLENAAFHESVGGKTECFVEITERMLNPYKTSEPGSVLPLNWLESNYGASLQRGTEYSRSADIIKNARARSVV